MLFQSFCAANTETRVYLQKPFKVGGYAVASDGNRFICKQLDDDLPEPPIVVTMRVISLIGKCQQDGFMPLPEFVIPDQVECSTCKGIGRAFVRLCPECKGEGEVDVENDYSTYYGLECKTCDGDGKQVEPGGIEQCQECEGKGKKWDRSAHVNVLGVNINPRYILAISDLQGLEIKPEPENKILLFRTGELKGAIMGMNV